MCVCMRVSRAPALPYVFVSDEKGFDEGRQRQRREGTAGVACGNGMDGVERWNWH